MFRIIFPVFLQDSGKRELSEERNLTPALCVPIIPGMPFFPKNYTI